MSRYVGAARAVRVTYPCVSATSRACAHTHTSAGVRALSTAASPWPTPVGITHETGINQGHLYYGNIFHDPALASAVDMHTRAHTHTHAQQYRAAHELLNKCGSWAGSQETAEHAMSAQTYGPLLRTHNINGERVDTAVYTHSYTHIYTQAAGMQVPSYAWRNDHPGAHVVRGALAMMSYQAEPGTSCPLTMTFAGVPALRVCAHTPMFQDWIRKAITPAYDPRNVPIAEKEGVVLAMSMTEKTGGSDVRSNTTVAAPLNPSAATEPGAAYRLRGHKWFTSAPNSDGFLTLAYADDGKGGVARGKDSAPSCFLVPRWLPDGTRNKGFRVMRLKEKLGDRSNASSEAEYDNAVGFLLGPVGRGVPTILEMVVHTRLDCALGSAGLMRQAFRNALWYCHERAAFGSTLTQAPAMAAVLGELSVETEAAVAMAMRMAATFDVCKRNPEDADAQAFRRLATAVTKFWVCKRAPNAVYEAMESIGGNGYVEEWHFPRWFRQSPLNSIWEGSGNVMALDILRTVMKEPNAIRAFMKQIGSSVGVHARVDNYLASLRKLVAEPAALTDPLHARFVAETLALALQASTMADAVKAGIPGADTRLDLWAALRLPEPSGRVTGLTYGAVAPGATGGYAVLRTVLDRELDALSTGRAMK